MDSTALFSGFVSAVIGSATEDDRIDRKPAADASRGETNPTDAIRDERRDPGGRNGS
jgi:hypothetical protein